MANAKVNYTDEQTNELVAKYQAGESVEDIAEAMSRSVRSVRAKLVREGVYVAPEKPTKAKREEGPTKKELLRELKGLVPFDVKGFDNAMKESIANLIAFLEGEKVEDDSENTEDDSENTEDMQEAA